MPADSLVSIAEVMPDLLGTYGDSGNATVLYERLRRRGVAAERVRVPLDRPVPNSCDIYVLGGGEDVAQTLAADRLRGQGGLREAMAAGRVVFAVCAGLQILGERFPAGGGTVRAGLGLLDVSTTARPVRAIGEILTVPATAQLTQPLSGFENHRGATTLGGSVRPLGRVVCGIGNGVGDSEGVISGWTVGTYLHGPALVRNPELADLLLTWAVGTPLAPLPMASVDRLRADRLGRRAVSATRPQRRAAAG